MSAVQPMVVPDRTLLQRMKALDLANDTRARRAQLKREVKAGRVTLRELVADPPGYALTMKVNDLLLAAPRLGQVKANKALSRAWIAPCKTLGGMSPRQREKLLEVLGGPR